MITTLEKAKSNRSTCHNCKKKIEKGETRGVGEFIAYGGHKSKNFYCKKCTHTILLQQQEEMGRLLKELL